MVSITTFQMHFYGGRWFFKLWWCCRWGPCTLESIDTLEDIGAQVGEW